MKNNKQTIKTQLLCLLTFCFFTMALHAQTDVNKENILNLWQQSSKPSQLQTDSLNPLLGVEKGTPPSNCATLCSNQSDCDTPGATCTNCDGLFCYEGVSCGGPCTINADCSQGGGCSICNASVCTPPSPSEVNVQGFTTLPIPDTQQSITLLWELTFHSSNLILPALITGLDASNVTFVTNAYASNPRNITFTEGSIALPDLTHVYTVTADFDINITGPAPIDTVDLNYIINNTVVLHNVGGGTESVETVSVIAPASTFEIVCPINLQTDGFNFTATTTDELNQAIRCASLNGVANGGDTINLGNDILLSNEYFNNNVYGRDATAEINTILTINGNGNGLIRDNLVCNMDGSSDADEFRLLRTTATADLTLQNISIINGCVDGTDASRFGGGLYNLGDLSLKDVVFEQNQAVLYGGGLFNSGDVSVIDNSLFDSNHAIFGGGIYSNAAITTIVNSTFANNSATNNGSAIITLGVASTISEISNVTFGDNTGAPALGFENGAVTIINNSSFINNASAMHKSFGTASIGTLTNTIFHNNTEDCNGVPITISANNLNNGTVTSCGTLVSGGTMTNLAANLEDNGCTTNLPDGTCLPTYAILTGSNAIDASASGTVSDTRGFANENTRDIGAYEYQKPPVGVAKDITVNGTQITMNFYLENLSNAIASSISLTDDLDVVFGAGNYTITVAPVFITDPGTLTLNASFDGSTVTDIITSGTLAIAAIAQIRVIVVIDNVIDIGAGIGEFNNQAIATAQNTNSIFVSDLSDNGVQVDADNNNNPSDTNEDNRSNFAVDPSTPVELLNFSIEAPR